MIAAGYSKVYSETPDKLKKTLSWQELMEKVLPDNELMQTHKEGLKSTTLKPHLIDRDDKGRPVYDYVPEDDMPTRERYLDLAYKIKNKYPKEVSPIEIKNYGLTDEQLKRILKG
jgi:hypothetical protein